MHARRELARGSRKLAQSGFQGHKAILIYGFEDPKRPLAWLIEAFELIAGQQALASVRQHRSWISSTPSSAPAESSPGKSSARPDQGSKGDEDWP
jgi:hypothetical protein